MACSGASRRRPICCLSRGCQRDRRVRRRWVIWRDAAGPLRRAAEACQGSGAGEADVVTGSGERARAGCPCLAAGARPLAPSLGPPLSASLPPCGPPCVPRGDSSDAPSSPGLSSLGPVAPHSLGPVATFPLLHWAPSACRASPKRVRQ